MVDGSGVVGPVVGGVPVVSGGGDQVGMVDELSRVVIGVVDDTTDDVAGGADSSVPQEVTQTAVATRYVTSTAVRVAVFGAAEPFGVIATSAGGAISNI